MALEIQSVSRPTDAEWMAVWRGCDYATYFHSPEWARLWEHVTDGRLRPVPRRICFSDGTSVILPLSHEKKLRGVLSRYVSSPECTFGGWIADTPLSREHGVLTLRWLLSLGRSLVWRLNPYDPVCFESASSLGIEARHDETHALDLRPGPDALFRAFKARYRSDIRRALAQNAVTIEPATTAEDAAAFHAVYRDSLRRWGNEEGYSLRLFETLLRMRSPHVRLWLARAGGQVVSGDLCFYARRHVVYWLGATLQSHLDTHASKLLKLRIIQDACSRGYYCFDFNPSAGLEGVKFFKAGFSAKPMPAPVVYLDSPLKQLARTCAAMLDVPHARLQLTPLEAGYAPFVRLDEARVAELG